MTDDFKTYVEQLLTNYDPNIDLSPDSAAQEQIITPLVALYGDDPLDTPIEKFLRTRMAENYPQLEAEGAGPLAQLLLGPTRVLLGPVVRAISQLKDRQRADILSVHTEESLTAKLSNLFLELDDGQYATGSVRLYYESPRYVEATTDKMVSTAGGFNFFPNGDQSITAANMLFNKDGAYYYFDIQVISQRAGVDYNVAAGSVTTASGFPGCVRVTNRFAIRNGADSETLGEFWLRSSNYPTEVSLNTQRGITALIRDSFAGLTDLAIVGYGDSEMVRDKIVGGGYGKPLAYALGSIATITLVEDGDYDMESPLIYVDSIDFVSLIGPVGDVTGRAGLDVLWEDLTGTIQFDTFDIIEIVDANTVKLESEINVDPTATPPIIAVVLREKSISISEIPGGFADPDIEPPVVQPDEIHVGGAVDIYVKDPEPTNATVDMTLVSDETYVDAYEKIVLAAGVTSVDVYDVTATTIHEDTAGSAVIVLGTDVVTLNDISSTGFPLPTALEIGAVIHIASGGNAGYYRIGAIDTTNYFAGSIAITVVEVDGSTFLGPTALQFVTGSTTDYEIYSYTEGLEKGYVLHLTSGEPGVYKILRYNAGGLNPYSLPLVRMYTSYQFTAASIDNSGKLYDNVEIDLKEPKNMRAEGTDLDGVFGTSQFKSTGGTNFLTAGVVAGDVLRVVNGPAEGDYTVNAVGGAGNTIIFVDEIISATTHNATYKVFEALEAPELPLLTINDIDVLDSGLSPIGVEIPCGDPLALKSGEFTNFGKGTLLESTRTVAGLFSPYRGSLNYGVDTMGLRLVIVYPNGISLDSEVVFTSVSLAPPNLTLAEVVAQINAHFGAEYAVAITIGAEQYLGIRPLGGVSIGALLAAVAAGGDARVTLGLDINHCSGTTNGVYLPVTLTADLSIFRDFVYIKTGINAPKSTMFYSYTSAPTPCVRIYGMENYWPDGFCHTIVGIPSLGRVRAYFKDPTYFSISYGDAVTFEHEGIDKTCYIHPVEYATVVPAHPTTTKPDLDTPAAGVVASDADAVFMSDLVQDRADIKRAPNRQFPGDWVSITYRQCWFDTEFALGGAAVGTADLAGEWMEMSVGDSSIQTISFSNAMTPQDVADKINETFTDLASIVVDAGNHWLVFNSQEEIANVAYSAGINTELNDFIPITRTSRSANYGNIQILTVDIETQLTLRSALVVEETLSTGPGPLPAALIPNVQYQILRPATYHIGPTEMEANAEAGFYYADFDMISHGVGDEFNMDPDLYGSISTYICKGYHLEAQNVALAFSPTEELRLLVTNAFLETGVEARPSKDTVVASNNIQIDYDYSSLVQDVNDYIKSDSERVKVSSPLGKHMLPHYVGTTIYYRGGPVEKIAKEAVEEVIETVYSGQTLEVSDIISILTDKGATYIQLPVQLYVLYHDINRSMWMEIVENTDNLSRLACYFADLDRLTLTRLT